MESSNWKVHTLRLSDSNKHKYQALTCVKCKTLLMARADHIKADEVKNCDHKKSKKSPRTQGPNWYFVGL